MPVIVTLCDFWFICPLHTLLRWNDTVCFGPRHRLDCVKCVHQLHGVVPRLRWLKPQTVPPWVRDVRALAGRNHSLRVQLAGARRIIALSQFQKQMFVDNGYAAGHIDVIPHGLEVESLGADGMSHVESPRIGSGRSSRLDVPATADHPRLIGYIGSLVPFKGAHVLLAALAAAPHLSVRCLIFGSLNGGDAYVARLRAMAQRDPRVELRGGFAPEEMGRVMREFEVLAMPALWHENGPLAVKAALYLGQPVLLSRLGSLIEMVDVGRTGWLVAPGDVPAWTAALRRIAEEPVPRFTPPPIKTIDDTAGEMLELYDRVAEEPALCV